MKEDIRFDSTSDCHTLGLGEKKPIFKITPGPWTLNGLRVRTINGVGGVNCKWSGRNAGEDHANAHLIVAAPELLEAAQALLLFLQGRFPDEPLFSTDNQNLTAFAVLDLEAAIRKAEGK